jgi:hypothetical protein
MCRANSLTTTGIAADHVPLRAGVVHRVLDQNDSGQGDGRTDQYQACADDRTPVPGNQGGEEQAYHEQTDGISSALRGVASRETPGNVVPSPPAIERGYRRS